MMSSLLCKTCDILYTMSAWSYGDRDSDRRGLKGRLKQDRKRRSRLKMLDICRQKSRKGNTRINNNKWSADKILERLRRKTTPDEIECSVQLADLRIQSHAMIATREAAEHANLDPTVCQFDLSDVVYCAECALHADAYKLTLQ